MLANQKEHLQMGYMTMNTNPCTCFGKECIACNCTLYVSLQCSNLNPIPTTFIYSKGIPHKHRAIWIYVIVF